tara:strand:+ start:136 stop:384 length:249 start_codon:yes stop_codon:yes gene_type:complete
MSEAKNDESDLSTLLCPLESIDCTLAFAAKDWSIDKNDAWIYGIVAGWDDDSLLELKVRFRWTTETVNRLKKLHEAFNKLKA